MLKKIFNRIKRVGKALLLGPFWYVRDLFIYRRMAAKAGLKNQMYLIPFIFDRDPASHTFDKHYVYMDRFIFKQLLSARPAKHVDVGSSIRFISMATTVTEVEFVDIRPVATDLDNYICKPGSLLALPYKDRTLLSLSCLHVAEHVGLGRYGDPLDPQGAQKACAELSRVVAPGGILYFAVPVGKPAIYFNSHRMHAPHTILEYFKDFDLLSFAAVNDAGRFIFPAKTEDYEQAWYACGIFVFKKR